jgi:uncharacterized protein (TIGR03437 family)
VAPWITVTSAGSGTGNGTVTFTAAANAGAARSGSILIGGQTYTVHQNGVATGTTAGCGYLIQSSTTQTVTTAAGTGMIQIITGQNCAWTAASDASWLTIQSGSSGTGNGAISYAVTENGTGVARSGSIVMAGQMVAVNQAGGAVAGTPFISAGGVVNTASYAPGGAPNGSLAQGSYFTIYGSDLGPESGVKADAYPLPKTLGGVAVRIVSGSTTYDAPLVFVSKGQINAIIPSTVPVGSAKLTIVYGGKTSIEAPIIVAKTSVGVFFQRVNGKDLAIAQNVASATDYPLNLPGVPAKPGQIVISMGDGNGPDHRQRRRRSGRRRHGLRAGHDHGKRHCGAASLRRPPAGNGGGGQHLLHGPVRNFVRLPSPGSGHGRRRDCEYDIHRDHRRRFAVPVGACRSTKQPRKNNFTFAYWPRGAGTRACSVPTHRDAAD